MGRERERREGVEDKEREKESPLHGSQAGEQERAMGPAQGSPPPEDKRSILSISLPAPDNKQKFSKPRSCLAFEMCNLVCQAQEVTFIPVRIRMHHYCTRIHIQSLSRSLPLSLSLSLSLSLPLSLFLCLSPSLSLLLTLSLTLSLSLSSSLSSSLSPSHSLILFLSLSFCEGLPCQKIGFTI